MRTQEWGTAGHAHTSAGGPDHGLALELVRVTEAAAIAAARWVGRDKTGRGRFAAIDAMHHLVTSASMRGVVVIGAGEKRDTHLLFRGAEVGGGDGPACDVAISAGDGSLSLSRDVPNALTAIAVTERGALYDPSAVFAMDKLAVGPDCVDIVDIELPVAENLRAVAAAKGVAVSDVVVAVLNRPRHLELVGEIREAGARVHLIEGGDVAAAIAVARPDSPVDLLLGTGGAGDGVVAAAALSCMGGALQARLWSDEHEQGEVLRTEDLVRGERVVFCATGVTGNELLCGVQLHTGRPTTESIVLCAQPATVWTVTSEHRHVNWGHYDG